jgi:hypothetical protein
MSGTEAAPSGPDGAPSGTLLARAALALYPPSWRARYADEVGALLDESGGGLAAVASLAWRAVPAWIWPFRQLHDRPARMRASVATTLMAWSMLVGLGLVFAQLTQLQGFRMPGHPVIGWAYAVFDGALAVSVLIAAAGGLPLWLLMFRRAHRELRPRDSAYLLLPLVAPAAYLLGLIIILGLSPHPHGVGTYEFLLVILAGFAAAATAAAGPGLALRRLAPRGPALRVAAVAAGLAAATMAVAAVAIVVAVAGLCLWAPDFAGYQDSVVPGCYLVLVVATATITSVSAARGTRAALAS